MLWLKVYRHYPEHFIYISSFNTHYNTRGEHIHFIDEELRHKEIKWTNVTRIVWERIRTRAIWFHTIYETCVRYVIVGT